MARIWRSTRISTIDINYYSYGRRMDENTDLELDNSKTCLELWIESDDIYGFSEALEYLEMYLANGPHKQFFWENDRNKVFGRITDKSVALDKIVQQYGFGH